MLSTVLEGRPNPRAGWNGRRWSVATLVIGALILLAPRPLEAQTCMSDAGCDDSNPCTEDDCICPGGGCPGICWNVSTCADSLLCNGTELCCTAPGGCDGTPFGQCAPGTPIDCLPGQFCTELTGSCIDCLIDDDCADGEQCTADTCDPVLGCQYANLTGACDDDNPCTNNDYCTGGACVGAPRDCNLEAAVCHFGQCIPAMGGCQFSPVSDGGFCDDGDTCTRWDECQGGECVQGPSGGCIDVELIPVSGGTINVGDVVDFQLWIKENGCPDSPSCPSGKQAIFGAQAVLGWDPAFFQIADPAQTGEPNPEDPCDELDPCNINCGFPDRNNWLDSAFPDDCFGNSLNDPCTGIPYNDGNAIYANLTQTTCNGNPLPPVCVSSSGLWVTNLKFQAIAPTAGVSGPTAVALIDCLLQSRTLIPSGESPGVDITGTVAPPALLDIHCTSGDQCPYNICVDGACVSCLPPTVQVLGSRYLEVTTPTEGPPDYAIYVEGVDQDLSCVSGYVKRDLFDFGYGRLQGSEEYRPPGSGGWGTVHVTGGAVDDGGTPLQTEDDLHYKIIGGRTYDVYGDCDPMNPGVTLSDPVRVTMWRAGDTDNNNVVDIRDAVAGVNGFQGNWNVYPSCPDCYPDCLPCTSDADCWCYSPHQTCVTETGLCRLITIPNVDLTGDANCEPNQVISILDIVEVLNFFQGFPDRCNPQCLP